MDVSELMGTCDTSQNRDEINPLGLLDLVYVEDEEETNEASINVSQAPSSASTKTNVVEEQKHTSDNSSDSDEGDELEPVAAVDVLPGREEDFFPEGMMQEVMEPSRNIWITSRVSNADPADHQWNSRESQLVDGESILQRVLEVPRQMWPVQIQPSGSHSTQQFTWKIPQQQLQALPREDRRQYYQQYRQKYPELIKIRNREYARRYRQANAERVRERQRAYIRKYRERKRLEKEQAGSFDKRSEESEIITMSRENGIHAAILLNRDNSEKEVVVQNMPAAMKSKNPEHILNANENNEIVVLS